MQEHVINPIHACSMSKIHVRARAIVHACIIATVHACTTAIVLARTMAISLASSIALVHARIIPITHACTIPIILACTRALVHACSIAVVHAFTIDIQGEPSGLRPLAKQLSRRVWGLRAFNQPMAYDNQNSSPIYLTPNLTQVERTSRSTVGIDALVSQITDARCSLRKSWNVLYTP